MLRNTPFFIFVLLFFLTAAGEVHAKSYEYVSIDADIAIHENTAFTVRETQTFDFDGEFHKGWREIPHNKLDTIRDVRVYNAETNQPLERVSKPLEPTDPSSWGKYTTRHSGGATIIEWYYDAHDEVRSWTLEYTVVGGLSFLENQDELYWNILTDYDVPIASSTVTITLPQSAVSENMLAIMEYLNGGSNSSSRVLDSQAAMASAAHLAPGADFTVAFGFPRGIVNRDAYWQAFFALYWGYFAGAILWIAGILFAIIYWYFSERFRKGRGTIIAEYEPPGNLPPAIGEVIVKEHITAKTWPATLVDLATRGYVKIEEIPPHPWMKYVRMTLFFVPALFFFGIFITMLPAFSSQSSFSLLFFLLPLFIIIPVFLKKKTTLIPKDYRIEKSHKETNALRDFERRFLNILFPGTKESFSTKDMRRASPSKKQAMHKKFQTLRKDFYDEVAELGYHTHSIRREAVWRTILIVFLVALVWASGFLGFLGPIYFFLASLSGALALVVYMVKFEVKLKPQGHIEREKWLGFKEFLYRTERYRVRDLTPELFYRLLPYAMIFGIEKQWAKHFESLTMDKPDWYTGSAYASAFSSSGSGSPASFSAGAFSASISSSFASAFSSSSGSGGASGGGGSAGGGGGGGGGGAG